MTEWYSPDRKPPAPRRPRPVGELLWEFRVNHVQWSAELHDQTPYGFDCQLDHDAEFFASHRFANRDAAIAWAEVQRGEIERGWKIERGEMSGVAARPNAIDVRKWVVGY
jgi:hypothetical protein